MQSKVFLISAVAKNRVIGRNNKLIWRIPTDLKLFKAITLNHTILCGKNTFLSIGKPLPDRRTIVVSSDHTLSNLGVQVASSVEEALSFCNSDIVYVIGGEKLYNSTLNMASALVISQVDSEPVGDTFFPEISSEWRLDFERCFDNQCDEFAFTFKVMSKDSDPRVKNEILRLSGIAKGQV